MASHGDDAGSLREPRAITPLRSASIAKVKLIRSETDAKQELAGRDRASAVFYRIFQWVDKRYGAKSPKLAVENPPEITPNGIDQNRVGGDVATVDVSAPDVPSVAASAPTAMA
jgi:hypothetical protein